MDIGKYMELADQLFEPAYIVDSQKVILFWNRAAEELAGYAYAAVVGKKCDADIMMHISERGETICGQQCPLAQVFQTGKTAAAKLYLQHKDGHRIPVDVRAVPLRDEAGNFIAVMEFFTKNGEIQSRPYGILVNELVKMAYVDSVTNLPNREYMEHKIKKTLAEAVASGNDPALGLLLVEVQNLRLFNEHGGIAVGNALLKVVARTLGETVGTGNGIACKWYGGAFIVLLDTNRTSTLLNWANKLKVVLENSTVPAWETEKIQIGIAGTLVQKAESPAEIVKKLECELHLRSKENTGILIV